MTASPEVRFAGVEDEEQVRAGLLADQRLVAAAHSVPGLSVWSPPSPSEPASTPSLGAWDQVGVVLGEPGPTKLATAAAFNGEASASVTRSAPVRYWTIAATVRLDQADGGTILTVDEEGLEGPVRALVVRRGRVAVLGWSWRGGMASWPTQSAPFPTAEWVHLAATFGANGQLVLYVNGKLSRVFDAGDLFPGRRERQTVCVGGATRFVDQAIPGWHGHLQNVEYYDRALDLEEVEQLARDALPGVEPVPPDPAAPGVPLPVVEGCANPAHSPAWRDDGAGGLRCLTCEPSRGCAHDEHEPFWQVVSDDSRPSGEWWQLECRLCVTASAQPDLVAAIAAAQSAA